MTTTAKKVGGPGGLLIMTLGAGYIICRTGEAVGKKGIGVLKTALKRHGAPCELKDEIFTVHTDGTDDQGLEFRAGTKYRVLECDADAILIELIGNEDNPHFVTDTFLSTVSDFPVNSSEEDD